MTVDDNRPGTPRGRGDAPIEAPATTALLMRLQACARKFPDFPEASLWKADIDKALAAARDEGRQEAVKPDDLYAAILDELVELWGEPADAVSQQVRPQVARSIVNRYMARHGRSSDPEPAPEWPVPGHYGTCAMNRGRECTCNPPARAVPALQAGEELGS